MSRFRSLMGGKGDRPLYLSTSSTTNTKTSTISFTSPKSGQSKTYYVWTDDGYVGNSGYDISFYSSMSYTSGSYSNGVLTISTTSNNYGSTRSGQVTLLYNGNYYHSFNCTIAADHVVSTTYSYSNINIERFSFNSSSGTLEYSGNKSIYTSLKFTYTRTVTETYATGYSNTSSQNKTAESSSHSADFTFVGSSVTDSNKLNYKIMNNDHLLGELYLGTFSGKVFDAGTAVGTTKTITLRVGVSSNNVAAGNVTLKVESPTTISYTC